MTSAFPFLAHTSISDDFINAVTTVLKLTHIQPRYYICKLSLKDLQMSSIFVKHCYSLLCSISPNIVLCG